MPIGSGLQAQVGVAPEGTYGSYVAPTTFWELAGGESFSKQQTIIQGGGPAAGRPAQAANRRAVTTEWADGTLPLFVSQKMFGIWLRMLFGGGGAPVQQAATPAYLQTHTLADNIGKSVSIQVGVPDRGGVVRPKTIKGGKVTAIEFSCEAGQLLQGSVEIDGQRFSEVESLAAASYPSPPPIPFHFLHMSCKLGAFGAEANAGGVKKVTVKFERPQSTEDFYAGAAIPGLKDEPIWNDWFKVSGTIETDWKNKTDFSDRWHAQSQTSMVLDWTAPTAISGAYFPRLAFQLPATFFTDGTPQVNDNGVTSVSFPFECEWDPTNGMASALYQTTDTAIV